MNLSIPVNQYRRLLGDYLRPQRARVGLLAALLLGGIGLQLLSPQALRVFIDTAQAGGSQNMLLGAAALFIVVGLAGRALGLATTYVSENVAWTATNRLRSDLTLHVLRLDMPFHKTHTPGELIERIDGDVTALANFFSQFVIRILSNMLLLLGVLLLLFAEDWRAGAALVVYVVITLAVLVALQNLGVRAWSAEREASAAQFGYIEERIGGTEDIRASGAEPYVLHRLYGLMRDFGHKSRRANMVGHLNYTSTQALLVLGTGLGLGLGAYLYTTGAVTIGAAFLIVYYIGMLAEPLDAIRSQVEDLQRARASIGRVSTLLRTSSRLAETAGAALPPGPLAVTFEHVSFHYNDEDRPNPNEAAAGDPENTNPQPPTPNPAVLHEVTFRLAPGRVLGLLGRTGSGKTTLTRLLFRLYDPAAGSIRLDGADLRHVAFEELRGRVGMVTQDVQLFQASIRDNVAFFNPRVTAARIEQALRELGLWEWAQARGGLDAPLGAGGAGLSAGEAQLLAFTRVLLKDPGLVILDEASSRLDPATERLLERAIDRLLRNRTGIIIAHRLRTVGRADDIMILDGGRVAEVGPRETLARDPDSRFYRLLQTGMEEALA
jgi:ABC-type multidrug transport system fused ATPase/permease subunit